MKELSIEEKAKRYDVALKVLHKYDGVNIMFSQSLKEEMFPELKESEDEKIRKHIIGVLRDHFSGEDTDKCIAWLEKREIKEHDVCDTCDEKASCVNPCPTKLIEEEKPADKVEPKFKVGDKVLVDGKVYIIKLVNEDNYIVDENGRDVQEHFSYTKDWKLYEQKPTAWSEEDETALGDALWCCKQAASIAKNENDMGNVWYAETWLKAIKDRVQPKQEWSEGDKRIIDNLISQLGNLYARKLIKEETKEKYVNWLKSLRHQSQWKPSDEQIKALRWVLQNIPYNIHKEEINGLLEQLKKLREE